jgi:hypothetical protein
MKEKEMQHRIRKLMNGAKTGVAKTCRWSCRHAVLLALVLLLSTIVVPRKVEGQPSPCCALLAEGLGTINITLGSVIGAGLQAINVILNNTNSFLQTNVWPQKAIAQALGMAGQVGGLYAQIARILQIPIATATLPNPKQLETILMSGMSGSAGQISNASGSYAAVYKVVPTPQGASPAVRDLIDMTDAVAQDAMQRAIAIDAIATQELSAADQINANILTAAPGTAPMIEAEADAWLVRANAYTQSALSDLMRVRAIDLADNSAHLKLGSGWAAVTQQNINSTLQHK